MDVSLFRRPFAVALIALSLLSSCGDRYNLANESGRKARIDDANFHLSRGECGAADEAINPLYASPYVTSEVRILKASALACFAKFNLLAFIANMVGASNYFEALAKALDNISGDAARQHLFNAVDILTQNGTVMSAGSRAREENSYMVFLQFGVISAIIRNYGSPNSTGAQGTNLVYSTASNPANEMSDVDACALAAAFSHISDSFVGSDITDSSSKSAIGAFESVCTSAGLSSCSALSRDRSQCDGTNQNSVNAQSVVTSVNTAW